MDPDRHVAWVEEKEYIINKLKYKNRQSIEKLSKIRKHKRNSYSMHI